MSDLNKNPRIKTEYVKVDPNTDGGSYWECARDFACGEVGVFYHAYSKDSSKHLVQDNDQLLQHYKTKSLYRKVETEITWQDCIKDEWEVFCANGKVDASGESFGEREFIKMCHLVASMTDKPE